MLMVILRDDKNTRKNNGKDKPGGHHGGKKGVFPRKIYHRTTLS
jgi:hypothetical protein